MAAQIFLVQTAVPADVKKFRRIDQFIIALQHKPVAQLCAQFLVDTLQSVDAQEFLRIYRLEGVNQELRAQLGNRFVLQSDNKLIYAAEFFDVGWDCGLDQENLSSHFVLSQTEWTS